MFLGIRTHRFGRMRHDPSSTVSFQAGRARYDASMRIHEHLQESFGPDLARVEMGGLHCSCLLGDHSGLEAYHHREGRRTFWE